MHTCMVPRCSITPGRNSLSHPDSGLFLHWTVSRGQLQLSVCRSRCGAAEDESRREGGPGRRALSLYSFLRRENLDLALCPKKGAELKSYEVKHLTEEHTYTCTYTLCTCVHTCTWICTHTPLSCAGIYEEETKASSIASLSRA